MEKFTTIEIEKNGDTGSIILSRPEKNNALNDKMIEEIIHAMKRFDEDNDIRFLLFKANGKFFCAGADLNWMKNYPGKNYLLNYEDSLKLSRLFLPFILQKKLLFAAFRVMYMVEETD
ncbi:MAG: hypothetical protein HC906_02525 [Bacteroidales bacterium]|nr:hypothetical protein [Bacteroidales bacterium]